MSYCLWLWVQTANAWVGRRHAVCTVHCRHIWLFGFYSEICWNRFRWNWIWVTNAQSIYADLNGSMAKSLLVEGLVDALSASEFSIYRKPKVDYWCDWCVYRSYWKLSILKIHGNAVVTYLDNIECHPNLYHRYIATHCHYNSHAYSPDTPYIHRTTVPSSQVDIWKRTQTEMTQ